MVCTKILVLHGYDLGSNLAHALLIICVAVGFGAPFGIAGGLPQPLYPLIILRPNHRIIKQSGRRRRISHDYGAWDAGLSTLYYYKIVESGCQISPDYRNCTKFHVKANTVLSYVCLY